MEFRERSFRLADADWNISDNRVLSLSNIFVVTPEQARSCTHRFPPVYHDKITKAYEFKEGWERLPVKARTWCSTFDEEIAANSSFPKKALRKLARNFGREADSDDDDNSDDDNPLVTIAALLNHLIGKFASWLTDCVLENTFQHQHVTPFLEHAFNSASKITLREGESHLINDPTSLMADCIGSYKAITGDVFDILSVEVKPPTKSSQAQLQSDFVKLGKELKSIIDRLIGRGVENPTACGVLVEGYDCRTYSLRLVAEGVYLMVEHGCIQLLKSPQAVNSLPVIIEHLMQLRTLLGPTIMAINETVISTDSSRTSVGWKRPSAGIPQRTNKLRER